MVRDLCVFSNFAPGEEYEDDPMMIEFANLDKQRQDPPEELQSKPRTVRASVLLHTTTNTGAVDQPVMIGWVCIY